MSLLLLLSGLYVCLSLVYWLWMAWTVVRATSLPALSRTNSPGPATWPTLSVIVPACNEGDKLESAVRTLLAEDYPDLEIILIDDRSTDATPGIVDRVAAEDPRVRPLHITELPRGWLGKVHALDRGLRESSGEFVLFTDADVHFRRGALRKAIAYCLREKLDHLAAVPALWRTHPLLDALLVVALRQILVITKPWRLRDPHSRSFLGVGAFNLVRRPAFEATAGFEWLRMETGDDVGLGVMMKRSGARCAAVTAFDEVALHWYRTLGEAFRGAEKGAASLLRFSLARTLILPTAMLVMELAPILTPMLLLSPALRPAGYGGLGVLAVFLFTMVVLGHWSPTGVLRTLASPAGAVLGAVGAIRAGILGRRRGGLVWRGTLYPARELLDGTRLPIP